MSKCSHYSKDTAYFVNIDPYIPGQMSKELDPARISRLRHGTMSLRYLTTVFISRHDGEQFSITMNSCAGAFLACIHLMAFIYHALHAASVGCAPQALYCLFLASFLVSNFAPANGFLYTVN